MLLKKFFNVGSKRAVMEVKNSFNNVTKKVPSR